MIASGGFEPPEEHSVHGALVAIVVVVVLALVVGLVLQITGHLWLR